MNNLKARLAGATIGALIAIGVGGAGMAMAQTADDSTTTTTPPATSTTPEVTTHEDANCPNMGTDSGGTSGGTSSSGVRYGARV
jgi:hypothetical protein